MKIQNYSRVLYQNNPLAEVVCQVRFVRMLELADSDAICRDFHELGYTQDAPVPVEVRIVHEPVEPSAVRAIGLKTEDERWNVSFSAESLSLVCSSYERWENFLQRYLDVASVYLRHFSSAKAVRIGLRYKDLIDRDRLGLAEVHWHELIQPFLLGALSFGSLCDGEVLPEDDVAGVTTQSLFDLEECSVVLQSALLRSIEDRSKTAFLIDSDFYKQMNDPGESAITLDVLREILAVLHSHAGAMFRRGIKDRLHDALQPN